MLINHCIGMKKSSFLGQKLISICMMRLVYYFVVALIKFLKYTTDNSKCYNFKLNSLLEVSRHKYICNVFVEKLA